MKMLSVLLAICVKQKEQVTCGSPDKGTVMRSVEVLFVVKLISSWAVTWAAICSCDAPALFQYGHHCILCVSNGVQYCSAETAGHPLHNVVRGDGPVAAVVHNAVDRVWERTITICEALWGFYCFVRRNTLGIINIDLMMSCDIHKPLSQLCLHKCDIDVEYLQYVCLHV